MEKNNKRKAELGERVEGRVVLLEAEAETPDGNLHDLIKMLEDHRYEVFKCNGMDGFLSQMEKVRIDIILTEENPLDPMYKSHKHLTKILRGMSFPVIMISSNDNNIKSHYNCFAGHFVRPILALVEKLFCDRMRKSGDVKRPKEEIENVELPGVEKRLKEEVEDAELPNDKNKKKLGREKSGEHHQRMVWKGDREQMFVKIVTELDKNGKATGKQVWERMQANGFKDISLEQINSHLQKHRGKLKNVHPVDSSYRMLEYKDQVDTSPGQDACRHGMEEHSSKTDAPIMNTINGNLYSTSQKHHLITESLNNNMQGNLGNPNSLYNGGNFENGKGKDIIQDQNCIYDDFSGTPFTQVLPSSPKLVDATSLIIESSTMGGCQGNSSMTMEGNLGNPNSLYNGGNFENGKGKDIIQDQNCIYDDFIGTSSTQVLLSSPKLVDATPIIIESSTMVGCQVNSSMTMEGNLGNPNSLYNGGNFENGKGKDIIQDQNCIYDDFIGTYSTQVLLSSPNLVDATPIIIESSTMGGCQGNSSMTMEGQPSSLFVNDIPGQAFDKNGSGLQSEEYGKVYTPQDRYYGDFDFEGIDPQQSFNNMDNDAFKMNDNVWGN